MRLSLSTPLIRDMDSLTLRIFSLPGIIFVLSLFRLTRVRYVRSAFLSLYSTNLHPKKARMILCYFSLAYYTDAVSLPEHSTL